MCRNDDKVAFMPG